MFEVLCVGDQECLALSKHRLTAERLRQMFAVDREVLSLMKADPDLERRMSDLAQRIDPERKLGTFTRSAQVHEEIPEIAQVLRKHQISGRDYMFTYAVVVSTLMLDAMEPQDAQRDGLKEVPELITQGLKFWRSMDPALKAEAEAWKKMRGYDRGINR